MAGLSESAGFAKQATRFDDSIAAAACDMMGILQGKRPGVAFCGGNVDIQRFCALLST